MLVGTTPVGARGFKTRGPGVRHPPSPPLARYWLMGDSMVTARFASMDVSASMARSVTLGGLMTAARFIALDGLLQRGSLDVLIWVAT